MPIAEMSGASRVEPRSGRYATRSTDHPYSDVNTIVSTSTTISASGTDTAVTPNIVRIARKIAVRYADTM
jgi:hypothetical protein